jgi:hypothetical protein
MAEPSKPPTERRTLSRPPSSRYAEPGEVGRPAADVAPGGSTTSEAPEASPSSPSALGAVAVAILGAAGFAVVGGILSSATGLLFGAGLVGALIGLLLAPDRSRTVAAAALAIASVLVGALGIWLVARGEGGVLGPLDYLWETFGLLVPAQAVLAALASAWGVRAGPLRT